MNPANWETKNVRAWNLRVGDRMSFFNRKTMRETSHPIASVALQGEVVTVHLGGRLGRWGMFWTMHEIVRVKRKKVGRK